MSSRKNETHLIQDTNSLIMTELTHVKLLHKFRQEIHLFISLLMKMMTKLAENSKQTVVFSSHNRQSE